VFFIVKRCNDILECTQPNLKCCGDLFDPKPYLTFTGVCFASKKRAAKKGIYMFNDAIVITMLLDADKSSGLKILNNQGRHDTPHNDI
jgi:hypothetical protein